jgi:hypothetical protein
MAYRQSVIRKLINKYVLANLTQTSFEATFDSNTLFNSKIIQIYLSYSLPLKSGLFKTVYNNC